MKPQGSLGRDGGMQNAAVGVRPARRLAAGPRRGAERGDDVARRGRVRRGGKSTCTSTPRSAAMRASDIGVDAAKAKAAELQRHLPHRPRPRKRLPDRRRQRQQDLGAGAAERQLDLEAPAVEPPQRQLGDPARPRSSPRRPFTRGRTRSMSRRRPRTSTTVRSMTYNPRGMGLRSGAITARLLGVPGHDRRELRPRRLGLARR